MHVEIYTSECSKNLCQYTETSDQQEPQEFYTSGSFPEGVENWPQVIQPMLCIHKDQEWYLGQEAAAEILSRYHN